MKADLLILFLLSQIILCCLSTPEQPCQGPDCPTSHDFESPQPINQTPLKHERFLDVDPSHPDSQREVTSLNSPRILAGNCRQANCATCTKEECTECNEGYMLIGKMCINSYALFGCSAFIIVLALLMFLKCFQRKRRDQIKESDLYDLVMEETFFQQNYEEMAASLVNAPRASAEKKKQKISDNPQFIFYHKNYSSPSEEEKGQGNQRHGTLDELIRQNPDAEILEVNGRLFSDYSFKLGLFFMVFVINITYALGIGIFLVPLCAWIFKAKFLKNILYLQTQCLLAGLGAHTLVYFAILVTRDPEGFSFVGLGSQGFEYFQGLLFICFAGASIASHTNEKIVILLSSFLLKGMDHENEHYWKFLSPPSDKKNVTEIISRLNIDASLFYMEFFDKTPADLKRQRDDTKIQDNIVIDNSYIFLEKPVQLCNLADELPKFEKEIFKLKFLSHPCRFDDEKAFGYQVAQDIVKNVSSISQVNKIIIILSLSNYFVFFIASFSSSSEWLSNLGWLYLNFFPRLLIVLLTLEVVSLITRKLNYLKTLSNMISANGEREKIPESRRYPLLNIFDFQSLETWFTLKKIFIQLNDKRLTSLIPVLGISMICQLVVIIILALCNFGILKPDIKGFDPQAFLILFMTECSVFGGTLFCVVFYGAKVNKQFELHRYLMNANKGIVMKMFRLYPSMIGENGIKPGTFIYRKGFEILSKDSQNLEEKLKILLETYESILKDLQFEEDHSPFRLFGIPVKGAFVKSLGTLIISLALPFLKQFVTNLLSK